jgi:hypothetical protein
MEVVYGRSRGRGPGVRDSHKGTSKETEAAIDTFIQFPGLGVESQYVQEVVAFPGAHHRRKIHQ